MLSSVPFRMAGAIFLIAAVMKAASPSGLVAFLSFVGVPLVACRGMVPRDRGGRSGDGGGVADRS